ncbi:hypothetical protein MY10362_003925 [Beauveria mimosiformis]
MTDVFMPCCMFWSRVFPLLDLVAAKTLDQSTAAYSARTSTKTCRTLPRLELAIPLAGPRCPCSGCLAAHQLLHIPQRQCPVPTKVLP